MSARFRERFRLRTVRLGDAQLRAAARLLARFGLRVELDPAPPPPPRRGRHAGIVRQLRICLAPFLPQGRVVVEGVSVAMPGKEAASYRTPDLAVCPAGFLHSEDRFLHPQDVDAAVEVVEDGATSEAVADAVVWYGFSGVPALLIVDPRTGTWTLHSEPVTGHYWLTEHGTFGDDVPLRRLGLSVLTGQLAAYGAGGGVRARETRPRLR